MTSGSVYGLPTARSVRLFVHDDPEKAAQEIYPMAEGDAGVWETRVGDLNWLNRKYYAYEVEVFRGSTLRS